MTHGDGSIGIQIAQSVGRIVVRRGVETFGGTGPSLGKGGVTTLSAIALSIKPGGSARKIIIDGGPPTTHGPGVAPLKQHGTIERLVITGLEAAPPWVGAFARPDHRGGAPPSRSPVPTRAGRARSR